MGERVKKGRNNGKQESTVAYGTIEEELSNHYHQIEKNMRNREQKKGKGKVLRLKME